jgi:hypothetical protein
MILKVNNMTVADSRLVLNDQDLSQLISTMKSLIETRQDVDWNAYNQTKKKFLEDFKALENSALKQKIWKDFVEVSDSARALKKVQEEEGEFAAEMISKALDALESDLENMQTVTSTEYYPVFDKVSSFKAIKATMQNMLGTVAFLNKKASQVKELREELIKTGMRLSLKGKLFDRLSKLGDIVFPKKKELTINLVEEFKGALQSFTMKNSKETEGAETLFQIRLIQGFLKNLVLKKQDYDFVKGMLDPVWKKATIDKDKKEKALEEINAKSLETKKSLEDCFENLASLVESQKDAEALKLYDEITNRFKEKTLSKTDYRICKETLESKAKPLFERQEALKEQKNAHIKLQQETALKKKEELFAEFRSAKDIDLKKQVFENLLSLQLPLEEIYQIKYELLLAVSMEKLDASKTEELYIDIKQLHQALRNELASSSMNLALSMVLCDVSSNVKQLMTKVLDTLD